MLNKDIHNGLEDKEIRDYLGQEINKRYCDDCYYSDEFIESLEKQLEDIQNKIKGSKELKVLIKLIKDKGWCEYDISSLIDDYNSKYYVGFIGNAVEFNNIITIINNSKNTNTQPLDENLSKLAHKDEKHDN